MEDIRFTKLLSGFDRLDKCQAINLESFNNLEKVLDKYQQRRRQRKKDPQWRLNIAGKE